MSYYAWPASAIGPAEMSLLFHARQNHPRRTTIAALLAEAVRRMYGTVRPPTTPPSNPPKEVRR